MDSGADNPARHRRGIGLVAGLAALGFVLLLPPPEGLAREGWLVAGIAALMAIWWVAEVVPIAVTALIPLIAFPLLSVRPLAEAAAPYAHPLVYLFLGGFLIAQAVRRWDLHRRLALVALGRFGTRPTTLIAGFMVISAGLSMWVSNTATAVMLLPIGLSVIGLLHDDGIASLPPEEDLNFAIALLLAIAYGASIGGLGTLIGTPPNALLAAYLSEVHGIDLGFGQWMLVGLPMVAVLLPTAWLILAKLAYPVGNRPIAGAERVIATATQVLGPLSRPERRVAAVFAVTASLWMLRPLISKALPWLPLSDPAIALAGAIAMFIVPSGRTPGEALLDWDHAKALPWGVLILFGGGLSLAASIDGSGLAKWLGAAMTGAADWPLLAVVLVFTALVVFLTEISSNTATAAVFLPLSGGFAVSIAVDPSLVLVPVALAASCAFMMPVATPPNAIVFSGGYLTVAQMVRAGLVLNLVAIVAIIALTSLLVPLVFDTG